MSVRKYYYLFYFYMMAKIDICQVFTKTYYSQVITTQMTLALEHASVGSDSAQILPSEEGSLESHYTTVIFGLWRVRKRSQGVAGV